MDDMPRYVYVDSLMDAYNAALVEEGTQYIRADLAAERERELVTMLQNAADDLEDAGVPITASRCEALIAKHKEQSDE